LLITRRARDFVKYGPLDRGGGTVPDVSDRPTHFTVQIKSDDTKRLIFGGAARLIAYGSAK